jgi:NIMA (never in mitosis gene a)-related kinase 1/4/5
MHENHLLHRDIKTENIFLCKNGSVKLGDFGCVQKMKDTLHTTMTQTGTPHYMSPEIYQSSPYSFEADIWALGVVLYRMCALKFPF